MKRKPLSAVAGILDPKGGFRVVVTERRQMKNHLAKGERLFVVPGFLIEEPVAWNYVPVLIRRVELYIEWWITTRNNPSIIHNVCIQNFLRNPNAYHNLRPHEHHYPGLLDLVRAVA